MCHLHLKLCTPSGAAILHTFAVFLGVLAFAVHHKPQRRSTSDADQQVSGVEAGGGTFKGRRAAIRKVQELLGKAGYTLSHARKGDLIVEYFVKKGIYDIYQINQVLFDFEEPLI